MRFVSTGRRNRNRTVSRPARSMLGQLSSQTRTVAINASPSKSKPDFVASTQTPCFL